MAPEITMDQIARWHIGRFLAAKILLYKTDNKIDRKIPGPGNHNGSRRKMADQEIPSPKNLALQNPREVRPREEVQEELKIPKNSKHNP